MSEAAKEYGRALFALAEEERIQERILQETHTIRRLYHENPGYARLLSNPKLPKSERTELLSGAFGASLHPILLNFLKLITERGYAYQTESFLAEYENLYNESRNRATADVISAVPLTEQQQIRLAARLSEITGKTVELSCRVDASLIGGIRVKINNTLFFFQNLQSWN